MELRLIPRQVQIRMLLLWMINIVKYCKKIC